MDQEVSKRKKVFPVKLMEWYAKSDRPMPWKGEKNPYLVWLSEIILQQTRVEQGWPYFEKFKKNYPRVEDLANAPEDEVMKLWEGLGYYSRARNLHFTAKYITNELGGTFPSTYADILSLKGIGPYTAAAIASFAYDLPHAVVDGNVYRVLSRYFGIATPIDSTAGKHAFAKLAEELLNTKDPAKYNQAIIDFGATQCTPKNTDCSNCQLQAYCFAFQHSQQSAFPVKEKKLKKRTRFFNYLLLEGPKGLLLQKRIEKDIWQGLYEFPLIEATGGDLGPAEILESDLLKTLTRDHSAQVELVSKPFQQQLTHQKIIAVFWEIKLKQSVKPKESHHQLVERKNLDKFAFPKVIDRYLRDKSLYLKLV